MMKTNELTGAHLDYWVARADGAVTDLTKAKSGAAWCAIEMVPNAMKPFPACSLGHKIGRGKHPFRSCWFYPSTVWHNGGPIIERERITLEPGSYGGADSWKAWLRTDNGFCCAHGDTPLRAAMRCYVASKFGDEVPDEVK